MSVHRSRCMKRILSTSMMGVVALCLFASLGFTYAYAQTAPRLTSVASSMTEDGCVIFLNPRRDPTTGPMVGVIKYWSGDMDGWRIGVNGQTYRMTADRRSNWNSLFILRNSTSTATLQMTKTRAVSALTDQVSMTLTVNGMRTTVRGYRYCAGS